MSSELAIAIRQKQETLAELRRQVADLEAELKEAKLALAGRTVEQYRSRGRRLPFKRPMRTGSSVDYAKQVLERSGKALGIEELILAIEELSGQKVKKATLVSNLSRYIQAGDTFSRPAASIYDLARRGQATVAPTEALEVDKTA